jgi:hypothetical protein
MTTPLPPSSPGPKPPNPFEAMLKSLPLELQVAVERTLRGFGITNNDDPLVQVVTALGLYAAYFEKIPERITDAGTTIDTQNAAALGQLDIRLRVMRGFAVIIQNATDRLGAVPQEIVDKFPTQAVADELRRQIDDALKTLPLSKFEESVNRVNTSMGTFINEAKTHSDKIGSELSRLKDQANSISNLELPYVSWRRDVGFILLSAGVTALLMWWFAVRPAQSQVETVLNNASFIAARVSTGTDNNGLPFIFIPKDELNSDPVKQANGDELITLTK